MIISMIEEKVENFEKEDSDENRMQIEMEGSIRASGSVINFS